MRHIHVLTQATPKPASGFQDAICVFIDLAAGIIGAIGGTTPVVDYLDTKCNFGIPDDDTTA